MIARSRGFESHPRRSQLRCIEVKDDFSRTEVKSFSKGVALLRPAINTPVSLIFQVLAISGCESNVS